MLSYGRLTVDFGIVVFAKTRWLFSYGVTFLPDARGDMLFYDNNFNDNNIKSILIYFMIII